MRNVIRSAAWLALYISIATAAAIATARADAFSDARAVYDHGDFGTARKLFEPLAEAGDAKAQSMMGTIFFLGRGLARDRDKAEFWYAKAAAQGEPNAEFQMFGLAFNPKEPLKLGAPLPKLSPAALDLLRKAAQQDHPAAQMWLGIILSDGHFTAKNEVESFAWLRKAAEFENVFAQSMLSKSYAEGIGTPVDNVEAYFWASLSKKGFDRLMMGSGLGPPPPGANDPLRAKLQPAEIEAVERRLAAWQPKPVPNFGTDPYIPAEKAQISGPPMPFGAGARQAGARQ